MIEARHGGPWPAPERLRSLIGSQPHASEVLNRRRALTLSMIRTLSTEWNLPTDALVREYDLKNTS